MESDSNELLQFEKLLHLNTPESILSCIQEMLSFIKQNDEKYGCHLEFFQIRLKNPSYNNWKDLYVEWASSK